MWSFILRFVSQEICQMPRPPRPFWRHKPFVSYQVNDIVQNALLPSGSPSSMESTDGAVHATVTTDVLYAIAKNIQQQP